MSIESDSPVTKDTSHDNGSGAIQALDEVCMPWMKQHQNLYDPSRAFALGTIGAAIGATSEMNYFVRCFG